jgi:integrase
MRSASAPTGEGSTSRSAPPRRAGPRRWPRRSSRTCSPTSGAGSGNRRSRAPVVEEPKQEPTFHEFASEWIAARTLEGLGARTIEDYTWALTNHLLPFFGRHRLSEITVREVDRYKTTKAAEGVLSHNSINKTLTRLSQVLEVALEYAEDEGWKLSSNAAQGRRRRLSGTRPRRPWVEPEQLMALLVAAEGCLARRGRPLVAVLAGAGLRIGEALALRRRDVNLARGELTVGRSKTEAGVRTVDLTPALRDELATYLLDSRWTKPDDLVFPTQSGRQDTRQNVRRRLLMPAIERANKTLAAAGIEPIGKVTPHGLRRTYATLRCAVGDDVAFTASQLGHEDARFTLRVYIAAVKRPERLAGAELVAFKQAVEWAQWALSGTSASATVPAVAESENREAQNPAT